MAEYINETCDVKCEDNGKTMTADILSFKANQFLSVSLNKQLKLDFKWNGKVFEAKSSGLTFVSNGPIITKTRESRR